MQLLIDWAEKSIDKASNQPCLPHAIVVLNSAHPNAEENQWNPSHTTDSFLKSSSISGERTGVFQDTVIKLEKLGISVHTTEDVLQYYYSSTTVVKIPYKSRYTQIHTQVKRLHQIISDKCLQTYRQKRGIGIMPNAETLPKIVDAASKHFSRQLDEPFDSSGFLEEVQMQRNTSLPNSFGEHILNTIQLMYKNCEGNGDNPEMIFTQLNRPIAACIMLYAARSNSQGKIIIRSSWHTYSHINLYRIVLRSTVQNTLSFPEDGILRVL